MTKKQKKLLQRISTLPEGFSGKSHCSAICLSPDEKTLYATFSEFVATVFDVLDHCTGIGWTSHNHTGDFTPVFAVGVGAEVFGGLNNNIDLPAKIRRLTGIGQ